MQVFFLSGLGADKTVFQFLDLSYCKPVFIDWIPPEKNESLPHYALRLKDTLIPDDATIVGLSFGGMLATEIARQHPSVKAILISSAKTKYEVPAYFRIGKYLSLHEWFSGEVQKWFMLRIKWLFGINNEAARQVYENLIKNCDPIFNKWAVNAILNWNNTEVPRNVVHIHGRYDKVLPYKNVLCDYHIEKGEHLMVIEQADIISQLLKNIIASHTITRTTLSSSASQFANRFPK